ncbi:MAG: hypothetical protein Q9225_005309 [Loekoesia sp. 1 TL-2023]
MSSSICCRKQNPVAPSRIAHDLNDGGFDPKVHLAIAQEGLRHLRDSIRGLPEIEQEYEEAVRALKDAPTEAMKERMKVLASDMSELKEEMEEMPARIKALESDIAMLKKLMAAGKHKGDGQGSKTQEAKINGGNDAEKGDTNGKEASVKGETLTKKVEELEI